MKTCLATSFHFDHAAAQGYRFGEAPTMQTFVPVGLLSLKAMADRETRWQTRVVELNAMVNAGLFAVDDSFFERIAEQVDQGEDLVGFMTDADSLPHTVLMAKQLRARNSQVRICLGGPASSPMGEALMTAFPWVDFVIAGEGEVTFVELLKALEQDRQPHDIAGLYWRDNQGVHFNGPRPVIEDLDSLPIPAFTSFDMAGGAPLYLDVGRGCPYKCQFCATAPFWDRRYRMKSTARILEEMRLLRDQYGRNNVNFSHDIFTCHAAWTREFCSQLIGADLGMTWTCSTRTDVITPELLELMAAAGCEEIYYGIETGSGATQKIIQKGLDLAWSRKIVAATIGSGIRPVTGFITGHPTETEASFNATLTHFFDFLNVGKVRAHLFTLCPFHEAPMYRHFKETIGRPAQYFDMPLSEKPQRLVLQLRQDHRNLFSANYRYDTPGISADLIDATEEISCHLVTLKSLWPVLLRHYPNPLAWFRRWVSWIGARNQQRSTDPAYPLVGDTQDLLDFVAEEVDRLDLTADPIAELLAYEQNKWQARMLSGPSMPKWEQKPELSVATYLSRRCEYLEAKFQFDLSDLLHGKSGRDVSKIGEYWVLFAKTDQGYIDTIRTSVAAKLVLETLGQPQRLGQVLEIAQTQFALDFDHGWKLTRDLLSRGLIGEVMV